MRYLSPSLVLAAMLAAQTASAQPANDVAPVAPDASLVKVLEKSKQALLWDETRDKYVLVSVGDRVQGYLVVRVGASNVIVAKDGLHFVLPMSVANEEARRGAPSDAEPAKTPAAPPVTEDPGFLDPYADPDAGVDRYRETEITTVTAPRGSRAGDPADPYPADAAAAKDPATGKDPADAARDPAAATRDPAAATRTPPTVSSVPSPVVAPEPSDRAVRAESLTLSRREFDAAIADFTSLGREIQLSLESDGVRVRGVSKGSLPYRMGLRKGDLVLDVDGQKIGSLDDAASVYARLLDAERFAIRIRRGGGAVSLQYTFSK